MGDRLWRRNVSGRKLHCIRLQEMALFAVFGNDGDHLALDLMMQPAFLYIGVSRDLSACRTLEDSCLANLRRLFSPVIGTVMDHEGDLAVIYDRLDPGFNSGLPCQVVTG